MKGKPIYTRSMKARDKQNKGKIRRFTGRVFLLFVVMFGLVGVGSFVFLWTGVVW